MFNESGSGRFSQPGEEFDAEEGLRAGGDVEEKDSFELIEDVNLKYQNIAERIDDDSCMIIDAILASIESNYDQEDPKDKWIGVLKQLEEDVLEIFEQGDADTAASNLITLESKVEKMKQ